MSWLLSNRDGGLTNEEGHYKFHVNAWRGNVLNGLAVTQNSPLGMNVVVSPGNAKVEYNDYGYTLWNDSSDVVPISTADPSNPRIDRIVVYIDRSETPQNIVPNNPGIPKVVAVAGTPAGSPNPPDDSTVDSAVGAGNPWFELAEVLVSPGVSTISNDKITDKRSMILVPENSVDSNALLPDSVTADKIDLSTISYKRRLGQDITTSNFLVTLNWTTRRSVTVTTTTGTVEVNYGFLFGNAGSGATRSFDLRDRLDGTPANTRSFYLVNTSTLDANLGSVNIVRRYEGLPNGSHTFDFQLITNAASAVRVRDEFLTVDELY